MTKNNSHEKVRKPYKLSKKPRKLFKEPGHYMGVVLSQQQRAIIEEMAVEHRISLSNVIRDLIDEALNARNQDWITKQLNS